MTIAPRHHSRTNVRVVMADDHELVRAGLKALLSMVVGVEVIAEACNGRDLIALVDGLAPDLVVTDISMPDMDGFAAISEIRRRHRDLPILVLSMNDGLDFVRRAVACGARGYIVKHSPPSELEHALRNVMVSGTYFSPGIAQRLLRPAEPTAADELTGRQIQILQRLAHGRSSKQIAFELGLRSKTVDVHKARIMDRLALRDVASLTLYAVRRGLVIA